MKITSTIIDKQYNDFDVPILLCIIIDTSVELDEGKNPIHLNTLITRDDCDITDDAVVSAYMEEVINQAVQDHKDDKPLPPPFIATPLSINMGHIILPIILALALIGLGLYYQTANAPQTAETPYQGR